MVMLSKECKPDNFESHNSLKLSFTIIWGLRSNFVDWESFLGSNSPHILALCETSLDDSSDSGNFSVRVYLPLIRKDSSIICMVSQFMWKKHFLLHGTYLWKTLPILIYVFDWLYFTQCLTSFSSIDHLLQLCARVLILFHLTQMRFSRSTHLLFLSLDTLTSIIRTSLPILVELIDWWTLL